MNPAEQSNAPGNAPATPQRTEQAAAAPPRRGLVVVLCLALAALTFAAFQPALDNDFVGYDDTDYVTSNPWVQRGLNWDGVKWAFTATEAANWHPLTWLSHQLDVQCFGLNPAGHHLTSVLLHALNVVLLFLTLRCLTGALWRSLLVAALFGLHPLRVESVAWIAERKDVLSTAFWLLTTLAYARYVRLSGIANLQAKIAYALMLLCFACGLMAKPMLVTLPCVLLLLDVWPLQRFASKKLPDLVLEKLPLFVLSFVSCLITFFVQRSAGAVNETMSLGYRLSNVLVSFVRYLGKIFWPGDLAFFYPHPHHWPALLVVASALLLGLVSLAAMLLRRSQPSLLIGWCWFLGTLVPVIGLVQVGQQSLADRYTYIPSVGILIALVWGVAARVAHRARWRSVLAALGGVAALACLGLTREQVRVWKNTESLCRHAIAVNPDNYLAHDMLGAVLEKRGEYDAALREHQRALELKPDYADAHNNYGVALQHQGNLAGAVEQYQRALQLRPRYPEAHYNLAVALESAGQFDNAATEYARAIAQRPGYAEAHYNLGLLQGRLGRLDAAVAEFQAALHFNPQLADAHNNLGVTLDRLGRFNEAIREYQLAIVARPDYPRAYFNLGVALTRAGQLTTAANAFETALRLKPDYAEARTNLAAVRAAQTPTDAAKP